MKLSELELFDPAKYLQTPVAQAEYIAAAVESGEPDAVCDALKTVARVRGMTDVAELTNPDLATVLSVLTAMGITLTAHPSVPARSATGKPKPSRTAA
jgi:DNA-binding phage protein